MNRLPKLTPESFPAKYLKRYSNDPVFQAMLRRTAGMAPLSQVFMETALNGKGSHRRVMTKTDRPGFFAATSKEARQ